MVEDSNYIKARCTALGSDCSDRFIYTEFQVGPESQIQNNSFYDLYAMRTAQTYMGGISLMPENLSLMVFKMSEVGTPSLGSWAIMIDPQVATTTGDLSGSFRAFYDVTKLFSASHVGGSTVYTSTSSLNAIKTLSTKKDAFYAITVINTDTEAQNITVNLTGNYPYSNITNLETGEVYEVTSSSASVGVMDSYEILYLGSGLSPTITSTTPINNTYQDKQSTIFSANLTDDIGLDNVTIKVYNNSDDSLSYTNTINYIAGEISKIQNWTTTLSDGIYTWFISLWDDEFKNTILDNQTLTIDTINPSTTLIYPTSSNYSTSPTELNYTASDTNLDTCWYSLNDSVNITTSCTANITGLATTEGFNNWTIYSNDSAGNENSSSVTFLVDTTIPLIDFESSTKENNSYITGNFIFVNISVTETNEKNITFKLFNTSEYNSTTFVDNSRTINWTDLSDGIYYYNVTIYDTSGNLNSTETRKITIDTINPEIQFVSPTDTDGTNLTKDNSYINYTTSDINNIYSLINFDNSIIGWWRMEGNANDEIGINNGTSNADLISDGRFGKGYNFNTTNLINISSSESLNITDSITLSAWVKIDSYTSFDRFVAKSPRTSAYPYTIYGLLTDTNTTGVKKVRMELASNGVQHVIRSTSGVTEGEWFLLTGTHDQSTNITKLYLNGVLDSSTLVNNLEVETNITTIDKNNEPVTIGRANYAGSGFDGNLDEVLILNRSLSAEEVMSLYNSSSNFHNLTNLDDGDHSFQSFVIDQAGNINETELIELLIDTITPKISIVSPINGHTINNYVSGSVPIIVNFSVDESNIDSCWYNFGSTNISINCSNGYNNFTTSLSTLGVNHLVVYMNDTTSHVNSSSILIIMNAYTGPQSGGGVPETPSELEEDDFDIYDKNVVCSKIDYFIGLYGLNYTTNQFESLRNSLSIEFGMGMDSNTLIGYITDYDNLCLNITDDGTTLPDEPEEEKDDRIFWSIIIGAVILLIILAIVLDFNFWAMTSISDKKKR